MNTYACRVYETIRMKDGEAVVFIDINLPFVPFVGCNLSIGETDAKIERVVYDVDSQSFDLFSSLGTIGCPCTPEQLCCVIWDGEGFWHQGSLDRGWELDSVKYLTSDWIHQRLRKKWQFSGAEIDIVRKLAPLPDGIEVTTS